MPQPLTLDDVQGLVAIEYDFVQLDANLENLAERVRSLPIPQNVAAARNLGTVRQLLQGVLAKIDPPLTAIVREYEAANACDALLYLDESEAPF